jgi:DNA-binding IclR family transcriptional regulator
MNSLEKLFRVLDIFLETGEYEIRLSELAGLSGLHIATVKRIVSALVADGYVDQVEKRGKYVLGNKFLIFAEIIKRKDRIRNIAMPYMIELSRQFDETISLFNWDHGRFVFVDEVRTGHLPKISSDPRINIPLYCTSIGKVLLADMPEAALEKYFRDTSLRPYTANTITDTGLLKEQLAAVKREGVAVADEEWVLGVKEVAAAVRDDGGRIVAGVEVIGPKVRLSGERMREIAPYLKGYTLEISRSLGYQEKFSIAGQVTMK